MACAGRSPPTLNGGLVACVLNDIGGGRTGLEFWGGGGGGGRKLMVVELPCDRRESVESEFAAGEANGAGEEGRE